MATTINATAKRLVKNANKARAVSAHAGKNLHDIAEHAGENVREFLDNKTQQMEEFRETVSDTISENPLKAVAAAAFGGLLLGAILRRI